ncbi:hypothetical protein ACFOON_09165 [Novosphingobium piscinae]|uniref:Glycosyltransferase RgtA/B/C/D-like domain-containing protein n=1 Tax=Novosphingobium piscinae TaxID=1507448 RepID=A0A7X1FY50_9SPHN|nr:hypothetical protein [Novosphingobium piscinae]MBC2669130.1 hypothetical protein [Novosphingobium piscinae]
MADHRAGLGGLAAPRYDRFARWPQGPARAALFVLACLLVLAAVAPGCGPPPPPPPQTMVAGPPGTAAVRQADDQDLRLYRKIIARVQQGDPYYRAAVEEQRRNDYPVTPGFTVRLPTLALMGAALGARGLTVLRLGLFALLLCAAFRRLGEEPGGTARRPMALALLVAGVASGLGARYDVLHEVWAAQLMALSFVLHRPARGHWCGAWLAAALALAVRELVLPYVGVMALWALWHRRRREALAWAALALGFLALLALHLTLAAAEVRPGDPASPSWLALKGLAGLLYKVNNSTFLAPFPLWLSGPFVVLCLFGWAGWRTAPGLCGFLLTLGYALGFMIVGRDNNFYWGLLITPLLFMGAAFLPFALPSLWRAAALGTARSRIVHA